MKLLEKKQVNTIRSMTAVALREESNNIVLFIGQKKKELNELETRHKELSSFIENDIAEKKKEHDVKVLELQNELIALEDRRKELMKPIDEIKASAERKLEEAKAEHKKAKEDRFALEQLIADVEKELKNATALNENAEKNDERSQEVLKENMAILSATKEVNSKATALLASVVEREQRLHENTKIAFSEINTLLHKNDKDKEFIESEKERLKELAMKIEDRQATLKIAFDEARRKNIL